jgi:beta-glucosidase
MNNLEKVTEIVQKMTLEEKASLCSGKSAWLTKDIKRLGIPSIWLSDGPSGIRKQEGKTDNLGIFHSNTSVCFPAGCASAASFDVDVLARIGEALGRTGQAQKINVLLGPAINIKRSPLCGRNFEYFSEDPLLAGTLAAAYINALQEQGIGASVKHYLANNQEYHRMTSSSDVDERTLREIYMTAFETVVKKAQPWTVMCSYNKINGTFASENRALMTDVLRGEWGFEGCVMSDWGAVHNRVGAVAAGVDLTMPGSPETDRDIVNAVNEGTLEEAQLDLVCSHILNLVFCAAAEEKHDTGMIDFEADHNVARETEEECAVLLKNKDAILPLDANSKIAFIGKFAQTPRYQGGGSANVNSYRVTSALGAVQNFADVTYCQGFPDDDNRRDERLKSEALNAAKEADIAVLFIGLSDGLESEGYDRKHMRLSDCQNDLVNAVCAVQENVVVVLHNGSPIEMPWLDKVKGALELYLGGEAVGEATINLLFGKANPSGRLPETFPRKLENNPSFLYYFGEQDTVEYREGVFVGYRYYETKKIGVLFPFGHGLSYTTFAYSSLSLDKRHITAKDTLTVTVDVTNTGNRFGKEAVLLFVSAEKSEVIRPVRELRAFEKIALDVGETKTVTFILEKRAFSHWDERAHTWRVAGGVYEIQICKSAHEVLLSAAVELEDEVIFTKQSYSEMSLVKEIAAHPKGRAFLESVMGEIRATLLKSGILASRVQGDAEEAIQNADMLAPGGLSDQPMLVLQNFLPSHTLDDWEKFYAGLNAQTI